VVVEGFLYDCNSFDHHGFALGKATASDVRSVFSSLGDGSKTKDDCIPPGKFTPAAEHLMKQYIDHTSPASNVPSFLDFDFKDIDGNAIDLKGALNK
jgi:hypothetical protein